MNFLTWKARLNIRVGLPSEFLRMQVLQRTLSIGQVLLIQYLVLPAADETTSYCYSLGDLRGYLRRLTHTERVGGGLWLPQGARNPQVPSAVA